MTAQLQQVQSKDFVSKLFEMLEDTSYQHTVRWSETGDSFIVLDNNEFTKNVLPLHFKHSNFASFVRQLNKYDFHKVRYNEEGRVNPYGDGAWEFKHRDFRANNKDLLENIKRKAPTMRRLPQDPGDGSASQINDLQNQVESLTRYQDTLTKHLQTLSDQYQTVVSKMLSFQRTLDTQDNVMQNIIQYIVNPESNPSGTSKDSTPFLPNDQAQKLISSYDEAARASVDIMNDLSQLGASLAMDPTVNQTNGPQTVQHPAHLQDPQNYSGPTIDPAHTNPIKTEYNNSNRDSQLHVNTALPETVVDETPFSGFGNYQFPLAEASGDSQSTGGLRVFTVGHLAPRQEDEQSGPEISGIQHPPNMPIIKDHEKRSPHSVRVRRQTFVPGWAVPPKILLVDDDAVYRNMSSKFLQVFGCEADVAVDGVSALDKVNVEKYDLILMDVVMPNLDGISATSLIRQFDIATPIISMTSNIHSNDIMHYFNSGMNDVLPKPFTKDSLLGMLEKHLLHLKQMQEVGSSLPDPIENHRLIELPADSLHAAQPDALPQSTSRDKPLSAENPRVQFIHDQDFTNIYRPSLDSIGNAYPQQQSVSTSTVKRRAAGQKNPFEDPNRSSSLPRSAGRDRASSKRAKYSSPSSQ